MSCNTPITVTERIVCARACTVKFNESPIAGLRFSGETLYDNSEYFDSGDISARQIRWSLYSGGVLIYDFDYNDYFDIIPEFTNGSTYNKLKLGLLNQDMIDFVGRLPNTIVPNGTKLTLYIDVVDNTGVLSQNMSNKYCFNK